MTSSSGSPLGEDPRVTQPSIGDSTCGDVKATSVNRIGNLSTLPKGLES
jgi:hypothetical protein